MLHLSTQAPAPQPEERLRPEPVMRLASLRNALRLVDEFGGGPASDLDTEATEAWDTASEAARRCFDRRTAELVALAAAGLEVVSERRDQGFDASAAALRVIAEELREGIDGLEELIRR